MKKNKKIGKIFKVKFPHFLTPLLYTNLQNSRISLDYSWFLAKNLSIFVSLSWKLHNQYCHSAYSVFYDLCRTNLFRLLTGWQKETNYYYLHPRILKAKYDSEMLCFRKILPLVNGILSFYFLIAHCALAGKIASHKKSYSIFKRALNVA